MALQARLALIRKLQQRVLSSSASSTLVAPPPPPRSRLNDDALFSRLMVTSTAKLCEEKKSDVKEVAVSTEGGSKKSRLFPRRRGKGSGSGLWNNWRRNQDAPALWEIFPSGLGNALVQATENINRLLDNANFTPSSLMARVEEHDDSYKVRYDMPGLSKEDVKVTVEDGVLQIRGEHKEAKEQDSDDEYWSASSYGYYNTSLLLPEDAKVDDIKAELKDGVLTVVIPRTEMAKKDVKEVNVQ